MIQYLKKNFVKHVNTNIPTYLGTVRTYEHTSFLKLESKSYNSKFLLVFYFWHGHVPVKGPGIGTTMYGIVP